MRKIYAAALHAINRVNGYTGFIAYYVSGAITEEAALGHALKAAREKMPQEEGWYGHQAAVIEIPPDVWSEEPA